MWELFALYLVIGAVSGFASGMMGVGGGVLVVPALYALTGSMVTAIATSLAASCIMMGLASVQHLRNDTPQLDALSRFLPGLMLGSMGGVFLSLAISPELLRSTFAWILGLIGLMFALNVFPRHEPVPFDGRLSFWGVGVGALSTLLGLGGGVFAIPLFKFYGMPTRNAIGTSAVVALVSNAVGSLSFLALRGETILFLPFLALSIGSLLTVSAGVWAAHYLPTQIIKRILGVALLAIAYVMG